jgi:hypothetical protein
VRGLTVRDDELRLLLLIPPGVAPDDASLGRYLRAGKKKRVHQGYKCRVRRYWYSVPIPKKKPHAFLPYMTGDVPRLIVNHSGALSTNLLHGLTLRDDAPDARAVSAAMLGSVTAFSAEVEGRAYGGGVLKLETRESERLLVPNLSKEIEAVLVRLHPELDALLRDGSGSLASRLVDAVLGIDSEPFERARLVFRTRRLERGARPRATAEPRDEELAKLVNEVAAGAKSQVIPGDPRSNCRLLDLLPTKQSRPLALKARCMHRLERATRTSSCSLVCR